MITRQNYFYFPILMFLLSWFIVLSVFSLSPLNLYPVANSTIYLMLVSILSVVMGYIIYRLYFIDCNILKSHVKHTYTRVEFNYSKIFWISILINAIIFASIVIFTIIISEERGGVIKYFANPIMSRKLIVDSTKLKGWNLPLAVSSYGVSLVVIGNIIGGILFTSSKKLHKIISVIPLILSLMISVVHFSRYALINPILHWIFTIFFITWFLDIKLKKKYMRQLLVIVLSIIILFLTISFVLLSLRQFTDTESQIEKRYIEQFQYYVTGNVVGLDQFLKSDLPFHSGKGILRTVLKWFSRIGFIDESSVLETKFNFVKISPVLSSNVFSYVRPLYEDFGVYGLLIFSLLWGLVTAGATNALLSNFSLTSLYLVVALTFAMFMSFYGFHFLYLSKIIYDVFVLYFLSKFIKFYRVIE